MTIKYAPTVRLDKGLVRGIVQSVDDSEIYLYQGLRFGRANRFEKPRPVEPWSGVFEATAPTDNPPQLGLEIPEKCFLSQRYSEDCLLLNVWKPISTECTEPRPVMVYIFGGNFKNGSIFRLFNEGRWVAHRGDVIVVTLGFRVGPFGFMFGGDDAAPANLGLHDQILGLKWIQENISQFGGDPSNVTIYGNSSGAFCVGALILSPLTKGLFHRASLQSGFMIKIPHKNEMLHPIRSIAKHLGCEEADLNKVVQYLKERTMEDLLSAMNDLGTIFSPVYGDDVLPENPKHILLEGRYNTDIDLMYGTVTDEGSFCVWLLCPELFKQSSQIVLTLDTMVELIRKMLGGKYNAQEIVKFYLHKDGLNQNSSQDEFREMLFQIVGDCYLTVGVTLFGEIHSKHSRQHNRRTFCFLLTQPAELHCISVNWANAGNVCHADELFFLHTIPAQTKPENQILSHQMTKAWAQFARNGDPGRALGNVQWTQAFENEDFRNNKLLAIGCNSKMTNGIYKEVCHFWKSKLGFE